MGYGRRLRELRVFILMLIDVLARIFPSTNPDSTFVFITRGVMALVLTVTYAGVQQGWFIRLFGFERGVAKRPVVRRVKH